MDLVADIGATNTRFALLDEAGMQHDVEVFANADHAGLEALLEGYLESRRAQARPRRAALAIAAPVVADRVRMVNIDWTFSQAEIARRFELEELLVVNDFAALARSLPELEAAELEPIGSGRIVEGAAKAALGPGSGLGIGAVVPTREGWAVVGGEAAISRCPSRATPRRPSYRCCAGAMATAVPKCCSRAPGSCAFTRRSASSKAADRRKCGPRT